MRTAAFLDRAKRLFDRKRLCGILRQVFAPQAVFYLSVLTAFWLLRYTPDIWQFDNCCLASPWQVLRTFFSFGLLWSWIIVAAMWMALYLGLLPALPRTIRDIVMTLLIAAEAVVGMAGAYMVVWYACPMRDMIVVLRATDRREVREYFSAMVYDGSILLPAILVVIVIGLCAGIFWGLHKFRAAERKGKFGIAAGALLLLSAALCRFNLLAIPDPLLEFVLSLNRRDPLLAEVSRTVAHPRLPEGVAGALRGRRAPVLGMVVIGESDNRHHHSLYGYGRRTDLFLEEGAEAPGTIRFSDAISATSSTIHSIFFMLTNARIGNKDAPPDYAVCEYFKALGVSEISLHDMQRSHGAWASVLSLLFVNADRRHAYADDGRNHYDGEMLDPVRRECREPGRGAKLVFVHLMGSHYDQRYRVPREWIAARPAAVAGMDNFDMSIVYTGYVLAELRKVTAELKRPAFLLYVPDHSEEPSSRRSTTVPDRVYYEIPMFLYFNDAYRREHPEIVALAQAAKDRPFQTDLVLQLIARLMDVPEELIDPAEDLLSPRYRPPVRLVGLGSAPYPGDKPRDPGP